MASEPRIEFDEAKAKALEAIYVTRDARLRRSIVLDALAPAPGETILDVGCGPGFYVADIRERVGEDGAVAGVDQSASMLARSSRRVDGARNVTFHEADAIALPFDSGTFDAVVCVQVLEYVDDVSAALSELRRVLRPGGRAVVWDVDWTTVSMHSADPARMRRVLAAWDEHVAHPSLPQTLAARLRGAGLTDVSLEGHAFSTTELTLEAYGGAAVSIIDNYLGERPDFPAAERTAWTREQQALGAAGDFYFSCVQCCFTARRPPLSPPDGQGRPRRPVARMREP